MLSKEPIVMSSSIAEPSDESSLLLTNGPNSYSLDDLSSSELRTVLPSPPPSFYRRANAEASSKNRFDGYNPSHSLHLKNSNAAENQPFDTETPLPVTQRILNQKPNLEYAGLHSGARVRNTSSDPLLILRRRQKKIQADVQMLLDAQSIGLMQGYEKKSIDTSYTGSQTSTINSSQSTGYPRVIPVRQPKQKQVRLRGARIGLSEKMRELVEIKFEEQIKLENEILIREKALKMVDNWEKKLARLEVQLSRCSDARIPGSWEGEEINEESSEVCELEKEKKAIEIEVHHFEQKLMQMKTRYMCYRGALRNTKSDIEEFLKSPPVPDSIVIEEKDSFAALPISKRSLSMATEWWCKEISKIALEKSIAENEKTALEEGVQMWEACLKVVTNFEGDLREEIANGSIQDEIKLKDQIMKICLVIKELRGNLEIAEKKRWNLLICAIGAELEALKEGHNILKGNLEKFQDEVPLKTNQSPPFHINGNDGDTYDIDGDENSKPGLEREIIGDNKSRMSNFFAPNKDSG
ncbi:hypothetical protein Golomagni_04233 [Golovinomyces magnicellulatus]|nr:hypothetical protein Golomagni_04233 [Golovinomyces magnicellulatus]